MTSPFINPPAGNAPQPQTVNMILKSLGASADVGGGDVSPTQLGNVPLSNAGSPIVVGEDSNALLVGECVPDRSDWVSAAVSVVSQIVRFNFFTARKSEIINTLSTITGATAAGATPTLCRVGVYSVNPLNGNLTLITASVNDTALWNAANTRFDKALATPWAKQAGTRYALASLCVTAAATPNFCGWVAGSSATPVLNLLNQDPRVLASLTGQSDLPASISAGSLAASDRKLGFILS